MDSNKSISVHASIWPNITIQ